MAKNSKSAGRKTGGKRTANNDRPRGRSGSKNQKVEPSDVQKTYVAGDNDASWYHHSDQLVKDAGRFSFGRAIGISQPLTKYLFNANQEPSSVGTLNGYPSDKFRLPGIMTIQFLPTFGAPSGNGSEPINVAANKIYSFVRHLNSGHANYDAPDLMEYLMAMDSVFIWIQHLIRAYGVMQVTSPYNRYMPEALVRAMGFNYADLRNNLAQFRKTINAAVSRINMMCVPRGIDLYTRHMWMCSGIYTDAPSIKSQFYLFKPAAILKYVEKTEEGEPAHLSPIELDGALFESNPAEHSMLNLSNIESITEELLSGILDSESFAIMNGDLIKAYGEGNVMGLSMISDDFNTVPNYRAEVLEEIRNATIFNTAFYNTYALYEDADTGFLKSSIWARDEGLGHYGNTLIAVDADQPSEDHVFVATRLTTAVEGVKSFSDTDVDWKDVYCGSEICCRAYITRIAADGSITTGNFSTAPALRGYSAVSNFYQRFMVFDRHPIVYAMKCAANTGSLWDNPSWGYSLIGDIDSYTVMERGDIANLHDISLLALFGVV